MIENNRGKLFWKGGGERHLSGSDIWAEGNKIMF